MVVRNLDLFRGWTHSNWPVCRLHVLLLQGQPEREICGVPRLISTFVYQYLYFIDNEDIQRIKKKHARRRRSRPLSQ